MVAEDGRDASLDLSGRVAVVTGAAAGLGRAEAIGLARSGATVVVNDMAQALDASDVFDEIKAAGSKAVAVAGDISQRATADELIATAEGLGGLNIVVNNAGITRDRMLFNMSDEDWDLVIAVHLRGHFLLTRNAAVYWRNQAKDSGGTVYGRIINTSSEAGLMGPVGQANYASSKAGLIGFSKSLAQEVARKGVTVNTVSPGYLDTKMVTSMSEEVVKQVIAGIPVGRLGRPEEIAALVAFIASESAGFMTGSNVSMNGGQHMY